MVRSPRSTCASTPRVSRSRSTMRVSRGISPAHVKSSTSASWTSTLQGQTVCIPRTAPTGHVLYAAYLVAPMQAALYLGRREHMARRPQRVEDCGDHRAADGDVEQSVPGLE